jgi:hypothetical protein
LILLLVWVAACVPVQESRPDVSRVAAPSAEGTPDAPSSGSEQPQPWQPKWDPRDPERVGKLSITWSGCASDTPNRPIHAQVIKVTVENETDGWIAVDIGRLTAGHTIDDLEADIVASHGGGAVGGPAARRPSYFHGALKYGMGMIVNQGGPLPSLLEVPPTPYADGTDAPQAYWIWPATATRAASGTWAMVCYRRSGSTDRYVPIGVVGPVLIR